MDGDELEKNIQDVNGRSYAPEDEGALENEKSFEVKELDSKDNPQNYNIIFKYYISLVLIFTTFFLAFISGVWSMVTQNIVKYKHVGHEVSVLGISLYIWGLGIGGIFFSPISEFYGRKYMYVCSLLMSFAFQCLTAFCSNLGGMLFGRFMSGLFGSAYLSVAAGSLSDMFTEEAIKTPLIWYTIAPFIGPATAPIVMGFVNKFIYYRWTFYIPLIVTGTLFIIISLTIPETDGPALLKKKAVRLRKEVDSRYYAPVERKQESLFWLMTLSFEKPIKLLIFDNMTFVLCFFTGFPMALLFLLFLGLPYIYSTVFHFSLQFQGLAFASIVAGLALSGISASFIFDGIFNRLVRKNGGVVKPEFRFVPLMVGILIFPVGLFIAAWTAFSHLHWIGPMVGCFIFGIASTYIFDGVFAYTEDAYREFSATAISTNTLVRCIMAGIFPLFGQQMYKGMGVHWATTLMALVGVVLIPIPFLFFRYGEYLRLKSNFTAS